jgi:hypothetical protein
LNYEQQFNLVNTRPHCARFTVIHSYITHRGTCGTLSHRDFTENANNELENSERAVAYDNEVGALAMCTERCCYIDIRY